MKKKITIITSLIILTFQYSTTTKIEINDALFYDAF